MDLRLSQIIAKSLAGHFSDGRYFLIVFYGVVFSVDGGAEEWLGMFPYYNRKTPGLAPASIYICR
jgi:hypothetical protein